MKKKAILLILSALVLAATGACALTATAAAPNYAEAAAVPAAAKIEVIGSAEITAEADTCVIGGQAECVGNTAGEAAALCAEKAAAIRAAAAPFGTVRVTDNGSGPVYNGTGCYARAYVTVTTHEVASGGSGLSMMVRCLMVRTPSYLALATLPNGIMELFKIWILSTWVR